MGLGLAKSHEKLGDRSETLLAGPTRSLVTPAVYAAGSLIWFCRREQVFFRPCRSGLSAGEIPKRKVGYALVSLPPERHAGSGFSGLARGDFAQKVVKHVAFTRV
jgi:hypothetical protein